MFSVVVVDHGLYRKLDTTAELASDLEAPLKKFGAHLKRKALARYRAQDFAPLAPSTIEKRAQKGLHSMGKKLARDVRRASGSESGLRGVVGALSRRAQIRIAVLAAFQKAHRQKVGLRAESGGTTLSLSQQLSLAKRTVRAVQKAINRPILGGLPGTLEVIVDGDSVVLRSHTRSPWTETHNSGGDAGHGAREPQRQTLVIEEDDITVLADLLAEHTLLPFSGSG